MRFFSLLLLSFLLSATAISAIGISPPFHKVDFVPSVEEEFEFAVVNKGDADLYGRVSLRGDFSDHASFSDETIIVPAQSKRGFTVNLDFPEEAEKPGKNKLEVRVIEESADGGGMSARAGVIGVIVIHVPYPGQYAEIASFSVAEGSGGVNEGEQASASFSLVNKGKEALLDTIASVTVQDLEGEVVDEKSFRDIDIESGARFEKEFFLDTEELPPSDYKATLSYDYGPRTVSRSVMFRVGNFDVELANHSEILVKNGIVPFEFDVRNLWKGKMGVEASLDVPGAPRAESSRVEFDDFATKRMKVFLDTSGLVLGVQNGTLTLSVEKLADAGEEASIEKEIPISFELSEEPVKESPGVFSDMSMVSIVLVVLVLLLGVNGYFLTRTLKHRRK